MYELRLLDESHSYVFFHCCCANTDSMVLVKLLRDTRQYSIASSNIGERSKERVKIKHKWKVRSRLKVWELTWDHSSEYICCNNC